METPGDYQQKGLDYHEDQDLFIPQDNQSKEYLLYQKERSFYFMWNSLIIYIFSYLLIYLLFQLTKMIIAGIEGIRTVLFFYEVHFRLAFDSSRWTDFRILSISVLPALIIFFAGVTLLRKFLRRPMIKPYFKMFILWLGFHSFNFALGGVISGAITGVGLGTLLDFLFLPGFIYHIIFSVVAALGLGMIGSFFTLSFLETAPSLHWLEEQNHFRYLYYTLLLPWFYGTIFLFLLKYPFHSTQNPDIILHDLLLSLTMFFLIVPMLFKHINVDVPMQIPINERERKIHYSFLIAAIILIILFRIVLTSAFYRLF